MANEGSMTLRLIANKDNFKFRVDPGVFQFDVSGGAGGTPGVVATTTTAANVAFGSVTPGFVYIRNLSTGQSGLLGVTTGSGFRAFARFKPGWQSVLPKSTDTTWQLKASTAGGTPKFDIRSLST